MTTNCNLTTSQKLQMLINFVECISTTSEPEAKHQNQASTFSEPIKINNNIQSNLSTKNMQKLMSYFFRNCQMKNCLHSDIIQIICGYQQVVQIYGLPNIPIMHSSVQSFPLITSDNQILIQIASYFIVFSTNPPYKYECILRFFEGTQKEYGYHTIHIPQQNKLYVCHGKTGKMQCAEVIYDEAFKPIKPIKVTQLQSLFTRDMFGLRSIVLNDKYFLIFCGKNIIHVYNYVTNEVVTQRLLNLFPNDFTFKSCGVISLPNDENEFLVFGNNAMYKIKATIIEINEMFTFTFDATNIDNELFKAGFILHEFGYALCDEFILICGGNYNDVDNNPIFSDDIYIYNIESNLWYKSKIKIPFVFNVKNNNLMFDSKRRMIHLVGANEYVDRRYDRDINPSSRCHFMFDADVLIDPQNMEPYVYENKKLTKTDYQYQTIIYM